MNGPEYTASQLESSSVTPDPVDRYAGASKRARLYPTHCPTNTSAARAITAIRSRRRRHSSPGAMSTTGSPSSAKSSAPSARVYAGAVARTKKMVRRAFPQVLFERVRASRPSASSRAITTWRSRGVVGVRGEPVELLRVDPRVATRVVNGVQREPQCAFGLERPRFPYSERPIPTMHALSRSSSSRLMRRSAASPARSAWRARRRRRVRGCPC
jgi:hypothetical protein